MKKLLFFLVLMALNMGIFAQNADSTKINASPSVDSADCDNDGFNFKLSLGKKRVKTRFLLLDLGVNTYHNEGKFNIPSDLKTFELRHGRSIEVNLHVYRQRIKIGNGMFNVEHGLSFDFNNYSFQNKVNYRVDSAEAFYIDGGSNIQKSRLFMSKMTLPLMLHFESYPKKLGKSFHFGVGAYASIRLGSNLLVRGSNRSKEKITDSFGLNDFYVGMRAEMGYGPVNLYMTYSFSDLFKTGQGPSLTPFSVGFSVIPF